MKLDSHFPADYMVDVTDLPTCGPDFTIGGEYGSFHLPLRITPTNGADYVLAVGSPKPGIATLDALCTTPSADQLCVISRGTVYLGRASRPRSFREIREARASVVAVCPIVQAGLLLLVTEGEVLAIDAVGTRWRTRRIAADGLQIQGHIETSVWGLADVDWNPAPFLIDLTTGQVTGGSTMLARWDPTGPLTRPH